MAILDKTYSIKLDVKNSITNTVPEYYISDNETSDILITITNGKNVVVLDNVIVLMVAISPDKERQYDFIDVRVAEEGLIYCNLKQQFKNVAGTWYSRLMLISNEEKLVTDTFSYNVESDDFVGMDDDALLDDRYPILTDMISRLSTLETTELSRVNAELGRVEAERQRELIKQQFITDVERLISDTNTNVNTTLTQNTQKVDTLVSTTTQKIDAYKLEKDAAIDTVFNQYKTTTTQDINTYKTSKDAEIDLYKTQKDSEIDQYKATKNSEIDQYKVQKDLAIDADLTSYKTTTTQDINTYKTTKDAEIDAYKTQKDSEINTYVESKTSEIDVYVETKNQVLDAAELSRQTSETARVEAEKLRVQQHIERETILNGYNDRLTSVETINETQNTRLAKVEYQNKVQDVFINGLFNENNNKRLTIEDEGNDIKLEGSVEGLATVDKVVGNTAVNYCLGGDRELTLNGDINVSGNELTITEGVDGGKVDVVCEGNTLVNCCIKADKLIYTDENGGFKVYTVTIYKHILKPNTNYTIITATNIEGVYLYPFTGLYGYKTMTNRRCCFTTKQDNVLESTAIIAFRNQTEISLDTKFFILEGDYTDKPIPTEYFEGLKSVGQNDTDGHGIDIVSRNKNLFKWNKNTVSSESFNGKGLTYSITDDNIIVINGTTTHTTADLYLEGGWNRTTPIQTLNVGTYTISVNDSDQDVVLYLINKDTVVASTEYVGKKTFTLTKSKEITGIFIRMKRDIEFTDKTIRIQLEENTVATPFTPHASNSIKIPLSEPLRGLPNGVKDRFVKKDGKWYVERNCGEVVLDGSNDEYVEQWDYGNDNVYGFVVAIPSMKLANEVVVCDRFPCKNDYASYFDNMIYMETVGRCGFKIRKEYLTSIDIQGVRDWFQQNPTTVVYPLATPTYEPLNVTPELTTYLEQTHISNNSLIPCNMSIKNTGFNAIIKPSTLYTVITDKTGDGSINCNLGGTVSTSSTNILTVTTPATLTENMLRLSGKGLTVKNVRLLEGDCTGLNYPYFEGLRNTFDNVLITEEMVQQGLEKAENLGKYKCNVKVRGKNLAKCVNNTTVPINGVSFISNEGTITFKGTNTGYVGYDLASGVATLDLQGYKFTNSTKEFYKNKKMVIGKGTYRISYELDTPIVVQEGVAYPKYTVGVCVIYDDTKMKSLAHFTNTQTHIKFDQSFEVSEHINGIFISCWYSGTTFDKFKVSNIQLEKTSNLSSSIFEPYYERNETVYLTSPLLKGDELVVKDDGLYHYHKMKKVVLNGSEDWALWDTIDKPSDSLIVAFKCTLEKAPNNKHFTVINNKFVSYLSPNAEQHPYYSTKIESCCGLHTNAFVNQALAIGILKNRLTTQNVVGFKAWLQANPTTVVYELAEPYYEKIADYPITLEIPTTASLSVDSELSCQSLKVTYTGNVPSLYHIEETNTKNTEYISDTQVAVDFILMNIIPMMTMNVDTKNGLTEKGATNMGAYFASRIMRGFLEYSEVVARYPQFKEDIDFILKSEGQGDLITK